MRFGSDRRQDTVCGNYWTKYGYFQLEKYYKDVRIIDPSASGLWERTSGNLLELL